MRVIRELGFRLLYFVKSLGRFTAGGPPVYERRVGAGLEADRPRSGRLPYPRSMPVALVCTLLLSACGGNTPGRILDFDDLVHGMEAKSHLVDRFRASFVKTRLSEVFNRALSIQGSLVFQKPNKFQLIMSGDINVELLSNGSQITLIHDQRDQETFEVQGDRDLSRFADPLMALIESIGSGGLREFHSVKVIEPEPSLLLQGEPKGQLYFERIERVILLVNDTGEIKKVTLLFKDGNRDETVFQEWQPLASDDPEILTLNDRLSRIMPERSPDSARVATRSPDLSGSPALAHSEFGISAWAHSWLCRLGFSTDFLSASGQRLSRLNHRPGRSPR